MNGFALTGTWRGFDGTRRRGGLVAIAVLSCLAVFAPKASAAGAPVVGHTWSSAVGSDSAKLSAEIDPNGSSTNYHFDYTTEAAYQADKAIGGHDGFTGALRSPASGEYSLGLTPLTVTKQVFSLTAATTYRYRVIAANGNGSTTATLPTPHTFTTQSSGPLLLDSRGWEMVSPIQKNGGQVDPPGTIAGGGVLQAASQGGSVTYGSTASFSGGQGSPPASQYLATRNSSGWDTQNLTAPIFSGTYDLYDEGAPYQLFSSDLASALLFNGEHCRSGASGCAVANPPLAGSNAPAGYQDYYRRDNGAGAFTSLLGASDAAALDLAPANFDLRLAAATPDLAHAILSTCAALTPGATEVPQAPGCDPSKQNLYEWTSGSALSLLNGATPGAALAAQSGAISTAGDRVYWSDTASGDLYLHDGTGNHLLVSGPASFQTATPDGATAFYTKAGSLYSYDAASHTSSAALASGVVGVLGASAGGDTVYFQDANGLQRWHSATTTQVAPNQVSPAADAADSGDYPSATGTARVSSDGTRLLFLSKAQLTGYDNTDLVTGSPDSEVYFYDAAGPALTCVSCNPTNERPTGPSGIPGAIANGTAPGSTDAYKPRVLSSDGKRAFFDSADSLALTDTNSDHTTGGGIADAYEWEAQGEGSCAKAGGCLSLVSSGRSPGGALFVDASADGSDAFFITDDSLIAADPGSLDLYDARAGGGFTIPSPPLACEGDACQSLPSPPGDPTLTTLLPGAGNPPVAYHNLNGKKKAKRCKKGFAKRKGKCVKKPSKHKRHHKRGGRR